MADDQEYVKAARSVFDKLVWLQVTVTVSSHLLKKVAIPSGAVALEYETEAFKH